MERKNSTTRVPLNPNAESFQPRGLYAERNELGPPESQDLGAPINPMVQPVQPVMRDQLQQSLEHLQLQQQVPLVLEMDNGQQPHIVYLPQAPLEQQPPLYVNNNINGLQDGLNLQPIIDLPMEQQPAPLQQYVIYVYDQNNDWQQQHEQQLLQLLAYDNNMQQLQMALNLQQQQQQQLQQQAPFNSLQYQLEKQLEYFAEDNTANGPAWCNQPEQFNSHSAEVELYSEKLQSFNLQLQPEDYDTEEEPEPSSSYDSEPEPDDGKTTPQGRSEQPPSLRQLSIDQVERNVVENPNQQLYQMLFNAVTQQQPFDGQQQPQAYLYTPIARAVIQPLPYANEQQPNIYMQQQSQPQQQQQQLPLSYVLNNGAQEQQQQQPSIIYQQQQPQVPYSPQQLPNANLQQQQSIMQQQPVSYIAMPNNVLQQGQQPIAYIPVIYQQQLQPANNVAQPLIMGQQGPYSPQPHLTASPLNQQQQQQQQQAPQPQPQELQQQQQQQQQLLSSITNPQQQLPTGYINLGSQLIPVIYQQQAANTAARQQQPLFMQQPMLYLPQQQLPNNVAQQPIYYTTIAQQPAPIVQQQPVYFASPIIQQQQPTSTIYQVPQNCVLLPQQQQQRNNDVQQQQTSQALNYINTATQSISNTNQQQQQMAQQEQLTENTVHEQPQAQIQPSIAAQPMVSFNRAQNSANNVKFVTQQQHRQQLPSCALQQQQNGGCAIHNCQKCRDVLQHELAHAQVPPSLGQPWLNFQQLQSSMANLNLPQSSQPQDTAQQQPQANNIFNNANNDPDSQSNFREEPGPMVDNDVPASSITTDQILCAILTIIQDHDGPITFSGILEQLSRSYSSNFEIVRSLVPSAMYKAANRGYLHRVNGGYVLNCDPAVAIRELNESRSLTEQKVKKQYRKRK